MPMPSPRPLPIGTVAITPYDVEALAAVADPSTAAPATSAIVTARTIPFLLERALIDARRPAGPWCEGAGGDAGRHASAPEMLYVMVGSLVIEVDRGCRQLRWWQPPEPVSDVCRYPTYRICEVRRLRLFVDRHVPLRQ
jgi:hypothetical protein